MGKSGKSGKSGVYFKIFLYINIVSIYVEYIIIYRESK